MDKGYVCVILAVVMRLLFFQNCISPHQVPYIKELSSDKRVECVCLITPRIDYESRKEMGWDSRHLLEGTSIQFYLFPSDEVLEGLLEGNNVVALFTGIRADKDVFRWFKLSLRFNVERAIITEAPNVYLFRPLWLHCVRFLLLDYQYVKYIQYVFAFGDLSLRYYTRWSSLWKVVFFSYCTENDINGVFEPCMRTGSIRLLFVGSVDKNKDVALVLKALFRLKNANFSFDIIGDGPEKDKLENIAAGHNGRVAFHGRMAMGEVHRRMPKYDMLILPSRYDGWGAVVNEALQRGLYVICSDKCGAKDLLEDERCGCVFKSGDSRQLAGILQQCSERIAEIRADRQYRLDWAKRCISGKVIARYMVDCLSGNSVHKPWTKEL